MPASGTDSQRLLRIEVRLAKEPSALMVVNHKGSIIHASAALGSLLGYNARAVEKMVLEDIVPVPYAQLHKNWIKVVAWLGPRQWRGLAARLDMLDMRACCHAQARTPAWYHLHSHTPVSIALCMPSRSTAPPPPPPSTAHPPSPALPPACPQNCNVVPPSTSCRSGRVVNFISSSNSLVPVRLDIASHDHEEHLLYVVKAARASAGDASSELMLELVLSPAGLVQEVVPSITPALFGFKSDHLLGKHLRSFVNVVREFCDKHGQDTTPRIMDAMADK